MSNRLKRVFSMVLCAAVMLTMAAVPGTAFAEDSGVPEAEVQTEVQTPVNENENEADAVTPDQNEESAEAENEAQTSEEVAGKASVPAAVQIAAKQMNAAIALHKFSVTVDITYVGERNGNAVTVCKGSTVGLKAVLVNATSGTYDYTWYKKGNVINTIVGNHSNYTPTGSGAYYARVNKRWDLKSGESSPTITVNFVDHNYKSVAAKDATCTEAGNKAYRECSRCGKMLEGTSGTTETTADAVKLPALGHDMKKTDASAASCTETGNNEYYTCDRCHKVYKDEAGATETTVEEEMLAALGHDMKKTDASAATCTENGNNEYYTCDRCHKVYKDAAGATETTVEEETLAAFGHDMKKTNASAATCTENGNNEYYTCDRCHKVYKDEAGATETTVEKETIPANGHTMKRVDKHDATCTEDGHEEYWRCAECGYLSSDREGKNEISNPVLIPATGHDLGEWKVTKEATVQAKGLKERACRKCEYKETAEIPMLTADKNTDVKKAADKSAETGDDMNIALYGLLALAAAAGAAGTLYRRKTN